MLSCLFFKKKPSPFSNQFLPCRYWEKSGFDTTEADEVLAALNMTQFPKYDDCDEETNTQRDYIKVANITLQIYT